MSPSIWSDYTFAEKNDHETVLAVVHRHWWNILSQYFPLIGMLAIIFGGFFLSPLLLPEMTNSAVFTPIAAFLETLLLVFLWVFAFIIWIDYYFDVWIITDERIINTEQKGLFVRQTSELDFTKVQDVTSNVTGILPTFLNFGDVFIQTAGEVERFQFRQVPDPVAIKDLIMRQTEKDEDSRK